MFFLGFITTVLIARALGPTGKGQLAYLMLFLGILSSYSHFGIINATTYFFKKSNFKAEDVFSTNINYILLITATIALTIIPLKLSGHIFLEYDFWLVFFSVFFVFFLCCNFYII